MTELRSPSRPQWGVAAAAVRLAVIAVCFAIVAPVRPALAVPVDLRLVLALDSSYSIDDGEFALQVGGIAAAFRNPELVEAITAQSQGRIAVAVIQWAGPGHQFVAVPWMVVQDRASADTLADRLDQMPRLTTDGATAIGDAIRFSVSLFPVEPGPERRVIDVSGDGQANAGMPVHVARQQAVEAGVDINGLAIQYELRSLAYYYDRVMVAGPTAFVEVANGFEDFAAAIRRKLLREIRPNYIADNHDRNGSMVAVSTR